jgi:RNA polymerase sigma-70 factor (ECF subfamily)
MNFKSDIRFTGPTLVHDALQSVFGFVPNLFHAQSLLPRLVEAEAELLSAVVFQQEALSRVQKERIFLIVAGACNNSYCVTLHHTLLRSLGTTDLQIDSLLSGDYSSAGLAPGEDALMEFSRRLICEPSRICSMQIDQLRSNGLHDLAIFEAIVANALARMLCTISVGVSPDFDFQPRQPFAMNAASSTGGSATTNLTQSPFSRPYLDSPELTPDFEPFAFFEKRLGVIPNLFRAQTLRPDVIQAEARAADLIVANEENLPQWKKECILLVSAAANLNSYCVAAHCAMLRRLGLPAEEADQIAIDHHSADLSSADKALLDFTLKLGVRSGEVGLPDVERLLSEGFTEEQVLESVVTAGFGNFLNTLVAGLGVAPDFEPTRELRLEREDLQPTAEAANAGLLRPAATTEDPDSDLVFRVQAGEIEAFEDLVRRHEQRVYRAMVAILRDPEAAQDAVQDAFLKAFKHIRDFKGRSRFATWLMTISRNTALQFLRDREEVESLDEGSDDEEGFRPRQVRAWQDNPEELCSKREMRDLVERKLLELPSKYRVVIMLRDIEQLPATEVAAGLNLSISAVKARLFRARLMLRDALAPRFAVSGGRLNA